jgi:hypothetical protein
MFLRKLSLTFHRTTRCYIPKDKILNNRVLRYIFYKLLLAFASVIFPASKSHGTHDLMLVCRRFESRENAFNSGCDNSKSHQ